jgi:hypothetical protein
LVRQQTGDGSVQPVAEGMAAFYKVPYALALSGQSGRGTRLCGWIAANSLDEEGDLGVTFGRRGPLSRYYHYGSSWVICGAQRLGQFGLSLRAFDFLASLQHPETGGFLRAGPEAALDDDQDVLSTAMAGLAALYMGREEVAIRAGTFLVRRWEDQPASGTRMYLAVRRGEEPVRVYPEELADDYTITVGKARQWYFVPGLAAGFLVRLWEATDNDAFLQVAQSYVHFCDSGAQDRYLIPQSGFFGWAASMLFAATGNVNYQRIVGSVLASLVSRQNDDGSWSEGALPSSLPSTRTDATAEGIILVLEMLDNLEAGA